MSVRFDAKVEYKRLGKTKREEKMDDWVEDFEKTPSKAKKLRSSRNEGVSSEHEKMLDEAKARLARALEKADNAGVQVKADYSVSVFQAIESAKSQKLL